MTCRTGPCGQGTRSRSPVFSAPLSTQAVLRARRFLAVTMAAGCSAGRLALPVFTPHGTLAEAAFDLGITIAGPVVENVLRAGRRWPPWLRWRWAEARQPRRGREW